MVSSFQYEPFAERGVTGRRPDLPSKDKARTAFIHTPSGRHFSYVLRGVVCLQTFSCRSYAISRQQNGFIVKFVNKTLQYCPDVEDKAGMMAEPQRFGGFNELNVEDMIVVTKCTLETGQQGHTHANRRTWRAPPANKKTACA